MDGWMIDGYIDSELTACSSVVQFKTLHFFSKRKSHPGLLVATPLQWILHSASFLSFTIEIEQKASEPKRRPPLNTRPYKMWP